MDFKDFFCRDPSRLDVEPDIISTMTNNFITLF